VVNEIIKKMYDHFNKIVDSVEVPVVSLITDADNNIVAISENERQAKFKICGHAEINVINKLFKKYQSKNLKGFKLYSTLEPCKMCVGAIEQTGLNEVFYFVENKKFGGSATADNRITFKKINGEEATYFKEQLKKYFAKLR
jgi:tRNA(adenine34) deaminase